MDIQIIDAPCSAHYRLLHKEMKHENVLIIEDVNEKIKNNQDAFGNPIPYTANPYLEIAEFGGKKSGREKRRERRLNNRKKKK